MIQRPRPTRTRIIDQPVDLLVLEPFPTWCQHLSVASVAEILVVSWNTANSAILAEDKRFIIEDPTRLEGVKVIGVDEHVWRHTRRGDKYATCIIDPTSLNIFRATGSRLRPDCQRGCTHQTTPTTRE